MDALVIAAGVNAPVPLSDKVLPDSGFELAGACFRIVQILITMEEVAPSIKTQHANLIEDVEESKHVVEMLDDNDSIE
jgi:hypothetical protein